ncbi:vitelline membrane outer layer protein 1 homolog [Macrobrachium rosenbergii]|uniref:vitelline membrane outer layer protein 1 homolog n=1 Tax=Macrobrachium rosenbergii TaxID=79674 RepID=UPI0034D4B7CF
MRTRVLLLFTVLAYGSGEETIPVEEIYLNNGLDRGDWGPTDLCAQNSWVSAFEVKYSEEGHIDNTGLNAVRLYCQDKDGALVGSVISSEGSYGEWKGIRSCPAGQYMVAMRGDVMPYQGTFGDDEGLVNLEMKCSNGTVLNGRFTSGEEQERPEDNLEVAREKVVIGGREMEAVHIKATLQNAKTGEYSLWAACSGTNRICGLASEVEHETTFTDDAGLCNIVMYCCTV